MMKSFCIITCTLGQEYNVILSLREIPEVKEMHQTFGAYDMVIELEADSIEKMQDILTWKVRKIEGIRSTLTLNIITHPTPGDQS